MFPKVLSDLPIHLIGAKGTGMCALAELLVDAGARVTGSDVEEVFYTDAILRDLGVPVAGFSPDDLPRNAALVVRSAAYGNDVPIVEEAKRRGLDLLTYPEALGALSRRFDSSAVAGVHGKTTTTALVGTLLKGLGSDATVVVGSAVAGFGDRSTWRGGRRFLVAETCEYRRHFLSFSPRRIVLTGIESDHQDYYPDLASIRQAFLEFLRGLPPQGELIFCADDPGATEAAEVLAAERPDLRFFPYGETASGPWRVRYAKPEAGINRFSVAAFRNDFVLRIPGRHIALDAAGALCLADRLYKEEHSEESTLPYDVARQALEGFSGSRRRSEIIGEAGGVLVMDDYAHHPTAIAATLRGLKEFHPHRRLVVDFMPHTFSRTSALFNQFASAFFDADVLVLQDIYASAREDSDGSVSGESLYQATAAQRKGRETIFCASLESAEHRLTDLLRSGDLYLTLGAGNNWSLGRRALDILNQRSKGRTS